jgi:Protein of unknown function (DUF642)/PEP-CTERM motif
MKSIKLIAATVALGLAQFANANIVVNGGFENPTQASGSWSIYESIPGWTLSPNIEIRNNVVGTAYEGSNYVELDTRSNSIISQTLATIVGAVYEISFAYSPRINVPAASNGIDVYFGGVLIGQQTGTGGTTHQWQLPTYFATATSTSSLLEFRAVGTSDGLGGSLDDVRVNAVPLPGTVALLGFGLVGFGLSRRRVTK